MGETFKRTIPHVTTLSMTRKQIKEKTAYTPHTPPQYAQLYSIHGLLDGHVVPLVYVLLANKTRTMYFNMFTVIRNAMFELAGLY